MASVLLQGSRAPGSLPQWNQFKKCFTRLMKHLVQYSELHFRPLKTHFLMASNKQSILLKYQTSLVGFLSMYYTRTFGASSFKDRMRVIV